MYGIRACQRRNCSSKHTNVCKYIFLNIEIHTHTESAKKKKRVCGFVLPLSTKSPNGLRIILEYWNLVICEWNDFNIVWVKIPSGDPSEIFPMKRNITSGKEKIYSSLNILGILHSSFYLVFTATTKAYVISLKFSDEKRSNLRNVTHLVSVRMVFFMQLISLPSPCSFHFPKFSK